jgi:hypothetical protein
MKYFFLFFHNLVDILQMYLGVCLYIFENTMKRYYTT